MTSMHVFRTEGPESINGSGCNQWRLLDARVHVRCVPASFLVESKLSEGVSALGRGRRRHTHNQPQKCSGSRSEGMDALERVRELKTAD